MSSSPDSGASPEPGNSGIPPKSGNSDESHEPRRDWPDLLSKLAIPIAIPVVVLIATLWFTGSQSHLTDLQHQNDVLDTYIGDVKDLLKQGLRTPNPGNNVSETAREETITTLQGLDVQHRRTVLQFLQDAHLIGPQNPVIDLSGANLSHDDLSNTDLSGIYLRNADLVGANLAGADLSGANMNGADLIGASLSGATLTSASLSDAVLTGADLSGTHLGDAILSNTSLSGADLSGADLSGADMPGADITQSQLDEVSSCTDATLATGLTCKQRAPIQLTYWYTESDPEKNVILTLINEFEKNNPDIQIKAVPKKFFQTRAAFTTAAQAGDAPDVLRSDIGWVSLFASEGYLLNIDSYEPQSDLSDYLNAPLSTTRGIPPRTITPRLNAPLAYDKYNGHLYGLPQVTDFLALLYNKKELENAGITSLPPPTMAAFEADAVQVAQNREKDKATYGFETGGTFYSALPFLYASGGCMFDQHNNIQVDSAGSVAGLNFLVNLQNADNVQVMPQEKSASSAPGTMLSDFMEGKTAMIFDGPYDVKGILTGSKSVFKDNTGNLGIAPIPMGPGGQTGSPLGGQSYVIYAGTAHPAEAYKFISFMSSTSSQAAIAEANHTMPTRQSAYQDGVSSDSVINDFLSIGHTAVARPPIPEGGYLFDVADPNIWAALTGAQSADEALNQIAYSWKQLGAGNLVSQSTFTPGTSLAACS
jgi:arabinogalactan oligomer/maltooligosaccharide transport system substrate-binding protein